MNSNLAYLLGALGDGCLTNRKEKGEYCIEYEQKVESWLSNAILPRVRVLYGKNPSVRQRKSGLFRLRVYSKTAFGELSTALENLHLLMLENDEVKANFIRGFLMLKAAFQKESKELRTGWKSIRKTGLSSS